MYPCNTQVDSQFPSETISVEDADPAKDFNEVSGRFGGPSTSSESEDSFQIVLNDAPRQRRTSDSDSEDSFIVFEEFPDGCYTSNEVLEETGESEKSDRESDADKSEYSSDLEAFPSKSVSKLADNSFPVEQSKDEVDCAMISYVTVCESADLNVEPAGEKTGLLIDDRKKLLRKDSPAKKVHFSEQSPKVRVMRVWSFAARQARIGPWDMYARDRDRFRRRIHHVGQVISWVFRDEHRHKVLCYIIVTWMLSKQKIELQDPKLRDAQETLKWEQALRAIGYDDKQMKEEDERRREEERKEKEAQDKLKCKEAKRVAGFEKQNAEDVLKLDDDPESDAKESLNATEKNKEAQDQLKWEETMRVLGFENQKAKKVLKPFDDQDCDTKVFFKSTEKTKEKQGKLKCEEAMSVAGFEKQKAEDVLKTDDDQESDTKNSLNATKEKNEEQEKLRWVGWVLRAAGFGKQRPSDSQEGDSKNSLKAAVPNKKELEKLKWAETMRALGYEKQKLSGNQEGETKESIKATEDKREEQDKLGWVGCELIAPGFGKQKPSDNQVGDTKVFLKATAPNKEEQDKLKWEETIRALGYEKQKPSDDQVGNTKESVKAAEDKKEEQDKLKWEEAMRALDF